MHELRSEIVQKSILRWAKAVRQWTRRWETGIYPFEMATFLGICDAMQVRTVIDSGRGPDAYSTHILGEFSERTEISVYSFDLTPVEKKHYKDSLAHFQRVNCLAGDVFVQLPGVLRQCRRPVALLVDGPKKEDATRLSLTASIVFDIRIIAHHNCPPAASWTRRFRNIFMQTCTVEDFELSNFPEWLEFRAWERQVTKNYSLASSERSGDMDRSLDVSSLVIGVTEGYKGRKRLIWKSGLKGWLLNRRWQRTL